MVQPPNYDIYVESFWSGDVGARLLTVDSQFHSDLILVSGCLTAVLLVAAYMAIAKLCVLSRPAV